MKVLKEKTQVNKRYRLIREIIETIILTVLMFVVINLAVQNYDVDGPSMEPSLHNQERIMVDKVSYLFRAPARGDVIVFVAPPEPTKDYVKRIIAVPGDVLTVQGTTVKVNNVTLNETYVHSGYQGNPYAATPIVNQVVPAGDYFVMGDDRKDSSDSRAWGYVPRKNIIGRAALVYWPFNESNTGLLPDVSSVFAGVQQNATKMKSTTSSIPLQSSTFGTEDLAFCAMPGLFLVCSRCRKKR